MSDKPEEAVKAEQGEKPEKPEKGERPEKAPKGEKGPKGDKGAKADKADKGDKAEKKPKERRPKITPRLKKRYDEEIRPALMKEFGLSNKLEAPRLTRVAVNMGLGEAVLNAKIIESAQKELGDICGQRPVVTRARKSIANFKLREGMPIGVMVTLRKEKMWEFVDRLFSFALPRVRDFKGVSPKAFDGRGNYTLGVREQIIFPEIDYDKVEKIKGMNITFVTTAGTDERGRALLAALGMPFRK